MVKLRAVTLVKVLTGPMRARLLPIVQIQFRQSASFKKGKSYVYMDWIVKKALQKPTKRALSCLVSLMLFSHVVYTETK